MNPNSQNSLYRLGIQTWQTKLPLPGAKYVEQYHAFELLDEDQTAIGRILLSAPYMPSKQAEQLLQAMVFSINCTKIELGYGEKLQFVEDGGLPVVMINLVHILADPISKRDVWKQLQAFINSL